MSDYADGFPLIFLSREIISFYRKTLFIAAIFDDEERNLIAVLASQRPGMDEHRKCRITIRLGSGQDTLRWADSQPPVRAALKEESGFLFHYKYCFIL